MASSLLTPCLLLLLGSFTLVAPEVHFANQDGTVPYFERGCGEDLSNLWLEIVFVVDNSRGMTTLGLQEVATHIVSVMMNVKVGLKSNNPRTSGVGIVTYNQNATVAANLDAFSSTDDFVNGVFQSLSSVADTYESYVSKGLLAAANVLDKGYRSDRESVKQLIIVYASTYSDANNNDPVPLAHRLWTSGISTSTVAFSQLNLNTLEQKLSKIASPGLNFTYTDNNLVGSIQTGLTQVNCFCPSMWSQYGTGSWRYGTCIRVSVIHSTWVAGKMSCHNFKESGYLVNEYSQEKHDFVFNTVKNTPFMDAPYKYHIGMSYYNNNWFWEQPYGLSGRPLTNDSWTDWNPGYPSAYPSVVMNVQEKVSVPNAGWENHDRNTAAYYVCEVKTCDTDNYCAPDDS